MLQSFFSCNSITRVKLEHLVQQIKRIRVMYLANFSPRYLIFLHSLRNQAPIPKLIRNFLNFLRPIQASQRDQVPNLKVLDLRTVIQRKYRVSLSQKAQEYDTRSPYINSTGLSRMIKKSLWGHVALSTSSIFDL